MSSPRRTDVTDILRAFGPPVAPSAVLTTQLFQIMSPRRRPMNRENLFFSTITSINVHFTVFYATFIDSTRTYVLFKAFNYT